MVLLLVVILACAVAKAALEVVLEENLASNAEKLGAYFRDKMNEYISKSDLVSLVRGKGLLNAIVINDDEKSSTAWDLCKNENERFISKTNTW